MTKAKQRYDEYCEYCKEVMKHCDQEWKTNCLETFQHILSKCTYFNKIRKYILKSYVINIDEIFKRTKYIKATIDRILWKNENIHQNTKNQQNRFITK